MLLFTNNLCLDVFVLFEVLCGVSMSHIVWFWYWNTWEYTRRVPF